MFKINDEVKFALPMIVLSTATNNKKCQTNKVVVTSARPLPRAYSKLVVTAT